MLRAGLYDTPGPDPDDHWAEGETFTDETDAAMVAKCLAGTKPATMKTALLGIAYTRIADKRTRPLNIAVPTTLKVWTVRVDPDKTGPDDVRYVMSDCSDAAKATAAVLTFDRTMRKASASYMT